MLGRARRGDGGRQHVRDAREPGEREVEVDPGERREAEGPLRMVDERRVALAVRAAVPGPRQPSCAHAPAHGTRSVLELRRDEDRHGEQPADVGRESRHGLDGQPVLHVAPRAQAHEAPAAARDVRVVGTDLRQLIAPVGVPAPPDRRRVRVASRARHELDLVGDHEC